LRAGAAGFLLKDSSRDLLYHAISAVVDGGTMVRSGLLRQAIQGLSPVARPPTNGKSDSVVTEQFTAREMEVLRLVAQGFANKEIAKELNLAEVTVKKYVQSVIAKLGVSDRTSAAIIAVRMGLVQ
ncbi:MAG: response regulator transcription factor, partial [Chloroflexi bacterium]|nr:response regulator transcription factor [Chloroflexota bacterium]